MKWERYAGVAGAVAVAGGAALAGRSIAAVASALLALLWYRADRKRREAAAATCFVLVCLLSIGGILEPGLARVIAGLGLAVAVVGRAVSRATLAGDGAGGTRDEVVRRHAAETAMVAVPAAVVALLFRPVEAAFGFWGLFFVAMAALAGLSALVRRVGE